ncbi:IclR family transcriptional regulator [Jiangella alkaliphila]|uniref:Transcriptional regulator, IclR family n=1 Tax=Jiangella alkaliphila TaxID=419479 RepID=A0A1H2K4P8_9ACTN|nr:IclR family transcriptional regulator [Jiangella alkaliphila]SDU63532.1 transcriptional regulator, IclR family [Jiangella alkaliphila]
MPRKRRPGGDDTHGQVDDIDDEHAVAKIDINNAPDPATATPAQAKKYLNRSVERVVSMLNELQEATVPMSLVDIHRAIDMPKATAFRYLWTLQKHRYVERNADGLYVLGLGFVGMQSRDLDVLKERARPWLERLRDDTGETTNLGVLDGNSVRYVEVSESIRTVRMSSPPGSRDPLYCTALGKAIAAQLPESQVRELLAQVEMTPRTARTVTTVDGYLAQLATVRARGFAIDDGENEEDGRCVAVALLGTRLPAALSVSGPASRFSTREAAAVAKSLIDVAERLQPAPHE